MNVRFPNIPSSTDTKRSSRNKLAALGNTIRHRWVKYLRPLIHPRFCRISSSFAWIVAYFLCLGTVSHSLTVTGQEPINLYVTKSNITFDYFDNDGELNSAELKTINYIHPTKYLMWLKTLPKPSLLTDFMLFRVGKTGTYETAAEYHAFQSVGLRRCTFGAASQEVECVRASALSDGYHITYYSTERTIPLFGIDRDPDMYTTVYYDHDGLHVGDYYSDNHQALQTFAYYKNYYIFEKTNEHPVDIWLSQMTTGFIGGYSATQALLSTWLFIQNSDFNPLDPPDVFIDIDLGVVPCSSSANPNCLAELNQQKICYETGASYCETSSNTGDTGSGDTGSGDTGSGETGSSDTGSSDTGSSDTGSSDTGSSDTGSSDTGSGDTGSSDTGSGETGSGETGDSSIFENFPSIPNTQIDVSTGFGGSGWINATCPPPVSFDVFGKSFDLPYDHMCFAADKFSYIIVATSMLLGLGIVMRGLA